jgi:pimeloyl-ACP methyl ester carboxylesterase
MNRSWKRITVVVLIYGVICVFAGIFAVEGALHPQRRLLPADANLIAQQIADEFEAKLETASITARDGIVLQAWEIRPQNANGDAVILLHGLSDNRLGMIGYARILLHHRYAVLLPDARAHGASGGQLATYGLLERDDIDRWSNWLIRNDHPRCVFGLGESMGAAQLLQALRPDSHFCAVVAESPFASLREITYDRFGQFFHTGPWLGRTLFRPAVEVAFIYAHAKYGFDLTTVSPEDSVAATTIPVLLIHGQIDHNIPVRHSRLIWRRNPRVVLWEVPNADHCGAVGAAPSEFENRLIEWFQNWRSEPKVSIFH